MAGNPESVINIGLVGGSGLCCELLQKTTFNYMQDGVAAPILAVSDPDRKTPGMQMARDLGLLTFTDYHDLYDPRFNIHLIVLLTPEPHLFDDILATRPPRIRIMSYHVFEIFWNAIGREERQLREQKTAMETVLNGIHDSILVLTPDMEIVDANEAFLKQAKSRREEVLGRKCFEVHHHLHNPCDDLDRICPLKEVIRNKRHAQQIHTHVSRNGNRRHFEVNVYPIWEKDGKIAKFVHISRDITQRMREEEEITHQLENMVEERTRQLRETHLKLLHQDKMASLGKLSASVVHEINNPIAGVLNLIMLIKRIMDEDDLTQENIAQFHKYLNLMETETRRISRIVSNLLAFSRQKKMEIKPLDINQLVDKTLVLNANLLKVSQVTVEKHLDDQLPHLVGSEDQLQQVFMNLISNAVEAMENCDRRKLTIVTEHLPSDGRIVIKFKDTGSGIAETKYSNLFEPFFTTKKDGKGVGLGLSVVYGIVKEHGGYIFVESEPGSGTTFRVSMPLTKPGHDQKGGSDGRHQNSDHR